MSDRSGTGTGIGLLPIDLVLVGVLGLLTATGTVVQLSSVFGLVVAFVAVLFAPGYAFVAALFPAGASRERDDVAEYHITAVERVLLSLGVSVCVVPLLGVGLGFTQFPVQSLLLAVVGGTTTLFALVAIKRRLDVPRRDRYSVPVVGAGRDFLHRFRRARRESTLTLLLVVGFVVAAGGLGVAVLTAESGEQYTEFYLTTAENGTEVAGGYPSEIPQEGSETVTFGITNREGQPVEYTVVVLLQSSGQSGELRDGEPLDTEVFNVGVDRGDTVTREHTIEPTVTGEDVKVSYLLYRGSPPGNGEYGAENAYRNLHFWIDVPGDAPDSADQPGPEQGTNSDGEPGQIEDNTTGFGEETAVSEDEI